MNGIELFKIIKQGNMPTVIPFSPTVYEHSAALIHKTPSQVARDYKLLSEGLLKSYSLYQQDILPVGIDIYNIEAEALGSKVNYYDNDDLPSIKEFIVEDEDSLLQLKIPNPEQDGRMKDMLEACYIVHKEVGNETLVTAAIAGPFTLAVILRGFENFIFDLFTDIEFALKQLEFAYSVCIEYAKAYKKRVGRITINESWISPPLLSPSIYNEYIYEFHRRLISDLRTIGFDFVSFISGGNTTQLAEDILKTKPDLVMADSNCNIPLYKNLAQKYSVILRGSIDSGLITEFNEEAVTMKAKELIDSCADYNGFFFGCGIINYKTNPENVIKLKEIIQKLNPRK